MSKQLLKKQKVKKVFIYTFFVIMIEFNCFSNKI